MSWERSSHTSVVLDGKIYVMGGTDGVPGNTLDTVEVYNPQADIWQRVASMPRGLNCHAATVMGGKIYVTGGRIARSAVSSAYVYDPQADTWTQLARMGTSRSLHASAAAGGKLYVFGGWGASGYGTIGLLSTAEVYDPASNSWTPVTSMTSVRNYMAAIAL